MGKTRVGLESKYGVFLPDSEWSRSTIFVNLLELEWSRSPASNFKIKTKNDASVKCDFDVTALVSQTLKSSESEYDIRKTFGVGLESELNCWSRSGVRVRNK